MIDFDIKKVRMVDSGYGTLDWMIHKEDIEDFNIACLALTTFVDIHVVSIMLGIEIERIEELVDEDNPDRDLDFPLPVVRRGGQVRWRLKSLIQYVEKRVERSWCSRYDEALDSSVEA